MSFLPKENTVPSTSNYMRLEEGDNTFRILGSFEDGTAIMGMEYWKTVGEGRKPFRVPMGKTVSMSELEVNPQTGELDMPKHFWAIPVWNYTEKRIQILELKQKTIMLAIRSLANNPKWGDPHTYDITITRNEEGGKTSYTTTPNPKEELPPEAHDALKKTPIRIEKLFTGEDPFAQTSGEDLANDIEAYQKKKRKT